MLPIEIEHFIINKNIKEQHIVALHTYTEKPEDVEHITVYLNTVATLKNQIKSEVDNWNQKNPNKLVAMNELNEVFGELDFSNNLSLMPKYDPRITNLSVKLSNTASDSFFKPTALFEIRFSNGKVITSKNNPLEDLPKFQEAIQKEMDELARKYDYHTFRFKVKKEEARDITAVYFASNINQWLGAENWKINLDHEQAESSKLIRIDDAEYANYEIQVQCPREVKKNSIEFKFAVVVKHEERHRWYNADKKDYAINSSEYHKNSTYSGL